jgi:thiol-disulfide isomerase/thioredoxin
MKRFLLISLLLFSLLSCKQEKIAYTIISGKITNVANDTVRITDNLNQIITKTAVDKEGVFTDTIYNANGFYNFSDGNEHTAIYLENGSHLFIELDTKEFDESIKYTGVGSAENNYLAKKYLLDEKLGNPKELYIMEETDFLEKMNAFKSVLEKDIESDGFSKTFKDYENKNLQYEYALKLQAYARYHARLTGNKDFKVSESFPSLLKEERFDDEKMFTISNAYQQLASGSFFRKAMDISKRDSSLFQTVAIDEVKKIKSELIKNNLLAQLSFQVNTHNDKADELYKAIISLSTDKKFKKRLTKKHKLSTTLVKGAVSPKFNNYENYNGEKTSLTDYLGKYVYIDVWATWCAPCVAEIPALKKLNEQFKDKNIVFISLSIDKKRAHQTWKDMIKEKGMGGVQLFAPSDWKSDFAQDYGISSIPRFILIDKEGKIINPDAPRPSDSKLVDLFKKLAL